MDEAFLALSLEERREALEAAAGRGLDRPPALLEKDVWVVWALQSLFAAPFGAHLVFKGGTSLSKAYGLIRRFSEDVDLTYDIRALTEDPRAGEPEALTDAEAKRLGRKIRDRLLPGFLADTVKPTLEAAAAEAGLLLEVAHDAENLYLAYPPATDYPAYVRPRVKLEFGARATGEPAEALSVACDLAAGFPELAFPSATPRVMRAERTFWEKATLAHVYCLEGKLRGAVGFARHWHDLVRLDEAGVAAAASAEPAFALAVADHKSKFFPASDAEGRPIDYHAAIHGELRLTPTGEPYAALADDYAEMLNAGYLDIGAEDYAALMEKIRNLEERLNKAALPKATGEHEAEG